MWWTCSACGETIGSSTRPTYCEQCATAGPVFSAAKHNDSESDWGELRQAWWEAGLMRAENRQTRWSPPPR